MKTSKTSSSRTPASATDKTQGPQTSLTSSPDKAKQESARLRRGREHLEASPTTAESDIRSSLI